MATVSQNLATYYHAARQRARRRQSLWNLLLFPLAFGGWIAVWYALFRLVWAFHVTIYPAHQLADFWRRDVSRSSFALSFLMVFALLPAAMAIGFMIADCLTWLVPAARRKLDAEAQGYPGTSFSEAMRALCKIGLWALPIGLASSLAAAYFLTSLR